MEKKLLQSINYIFEKGYLGVFEIRKNIFILSDIRNYNNHHQYPLIFFSAIQN